jgi:diguanylate cyclase (GGDEF)-like protein
MPLGWVLYALRGAIPDFWSVIVANAVLAWAYAELAIAVRLYFGAPARRALLLSLVVVTAVLAALFTYALPTYRALIAGVSAAGSVLLGLAALPLLTSKRKSRRASHWLTASVFIAGAVLFGARALYETFSAHGTSSLFEPSLVQSVFFAYATAAPALASIGFVLMCNERFQSQLERLASMDALTGTYNRRTLEDLGRRTLARARRQGRAASVLLIDADHFKRINDEYGHEAGDAVLIDLVQRIRNALRTEDLVGRLGGEEFAVLMPDTGEADAKLVAERLRSAVPATEMPIGARALRVTVSVGVATLSPDDENLADLLRRADQAMYAAKRRGRDRVVVATAHAVH